MKKKDFVKTMLLSSALVSSVCLLGGCAGGSANAQNTLSPQEQQKETQPTDKTAVEEEPKAEQTDMEADDKAEVCYDALNDFSYKFFAENMEEDNPVLSPVSAYMALSMAGLGAEHNTKAEFASVFGDYADMTTLCNDVMTTFPTATQSNTIALANSAWISENFSVSDNWLSDINTVLHSEAFQRDLTSPDIVGEMNGWISEHTNGMIDKMVEQPFKDYTGLVLYNTVYFKAKWEAPFEPYAVYSDKFYLEDGREINAEFMHRQDDMEYLSNDFAQGLLFPYRYEEEDAQYAFVALKPADENTTIRDLYKQLTPLVISELLAGKQTDLVNTKLPKFEIEFDKQLNDSLKNMGLKDAFDVGKADFSGIGADNSTESVNENAKNNLNQYNLYIDLVRQKAKIIVDEEGTEAAAVTQAIMECGAAMPVVEPKEIFFDRPFVYMIMNMDNEVPLFIGILDSPAACAKQP